MKKQQTNSNTKDIKSIFREQLTSFVLELKSHVSNDSNDWTIKGFIDIFKNIYTISSDTKIISKILEIHIFPKILKFASEFNYNIVLADHQNYYPDISFVNKDDESIKFALDLKTTYRLPNNPEYCNGFTLGSHGEYFTNRTSKKNIQFPYNEYLAHYCLGIIYSRNTIDDIDETKVYTFEKLKSIISVIKDFEFFICEKWEIASERSGSGNTANIGSITRIEDIINCNGMFKNLGEKVFDDYWMNYGKITITDIDNKEKKIKNLKDFLNFKGIDINKINNSTKNRKNQ